MRVILAAIFALLASAHAMADVRDFLGRTLVDVRVEVGGVAVVDPSILQLIETVIGEPLSMERVRETVDHLVGLGRFEDIRVFAEASPDRPEGVRLRWTLVPLQRIAKVDISGQPVISANVLRGQIAERVGTMPPTSRIAEILQSVSSYFAERGYRDPKIDTTLVATAAAELVTLHLAIDAGPRTTIGNVVVRSDAPDGPGEVVDELRLNRGRPFDRPAIDARVADYTDRLRDLGFYEARIDVTPTFAADGAADLTVDVERGPRVRVVFAGDPLPENRRDALVPIREERSVDLDLLEDASRNIAAFLRQQGYRSADAAYVREQKGDEMVLTFTVVRGPLHRLASIDVTGTSAVPRADIQPLLALKPGEPFSDSRVAAVAAAVTELYRVRGFAGVVVKPDVLVTSPESSGGEGRPVTVRLVVAEGPRTAVGDVSIAGAGELTEARIRPLLSVTSGKPFYRPQLDADRDAIERLYQNEGFQNARVDAVTSLRDEGQRLDVQWTVHEGTRAMVDRILVSGNTRTSAELIRQEIVLKPGAALGDEAMIESQRRLATLGLFRRVRIVELPHGANATRDILIEVEEAPPTTIAYGGGLESGRQLVTAADSGQAEDRIYFAPRAFFQVVRRNLWGKNRSVSLFSRISLRPIDADTNSTDPADDGGYGFNEYRVIGTFREPRLIDTPGDLQITGFVEQAVRSSFNFRRRGVRVEYGRRLGNTLTMSGRYAFDKTALFNTKIVDDDLGLLIDRRFPQVRLSTVTGSVLRDTRDDLLDPSRGTLLGVDSTIAARSLGSEVGFAKTFGQVFVYRRLPGGAPVTFVAGARLGAAVGFARTLDDEVVDDVPASERFFAGGDTTVRGFVLDRLGAATTLNERGFPTGGSGLVVMNGELRTGYWKGVGGVGFVDAGNVFRRAGEIRIGDLRPAAGFGIRYRSPIGPLRVDLGFNLDRQLLPTGVRERASVFHISLGQAF